MLVEIVAPQQQLKGLARHWRQKARVLPSGVEMTFGQRADGSKLVQAVHFDTEEWTRKMARAWLAEHGLSAELLCSMEAPAAGKLVVDVSRVDGEFSVLGKQDELQIAFGWLYVCKRADGSVVVDHSGEVISIKDLERAGYGYALDSRVAGCMHMKNADGSTIQVGRMCEMVVFTEEKRAAMKVPPGVLPDAMWIGLKIDDAGVWARIKSGELRMFSLGGTAIRRALGSVQ